MGEKEYIIPYSKDARKRHYHSAIRSKVVKFMVNGTGRRLSGMIVPMVMLIGIPII